MTRSIPPSPVYIYGLVDPRTDELRYVGKSHDPQARLADHLLPSALCRTPYVARWLRTLVDHGLRPHQVILEITDSDGWQEAERRHIREARSRGCRLTNLRAGGDGCPAGKKQGPKPHSPEHRAKLSAANKGKRLPAEQVAKMRAASAGRRHSAETKAKMRANNVGKTLPAETRAKIGAARVGKPCRQSPEARARIAASLPRGEAHWGAKLTTSMVHEMRERFAAGGIRKATLAREYGVSQSTIGRALRSKSWLVIAESSEASQRAERAP